MKSHELDHHRLKLQNIRDQLVQDEHVGAEGDLTVNYLVLLMDRLLAILYDTQPSGG